LREPEMNGSLRCVLKLKSFPFSSSKQPSASSANPPGLRSRWQFARHAASPATRPKPPSGCRRSYTSNGPS